MSKLAEVYGKYKKPKAKKVIGKDFSYADLGNCYSYVRITYSVDGREFTDQLTLVEFFEFIGERLSKNCRT